MGTASKITGTLATAISKISGVAISGISNIMGQTISLFTTNATSLEFDGTNDYIDCGTDDSIKPTAAITYNAWVYKDNWNDQNNSPFNTIMGNFKTSTGIYTRWKNRRIQCWARLNNDLDDYSNGSNQYVQTGWNKFKSGKPYYRASGWHMITVTFDGRYLKLYIDGALESSGGTPTYDTGATGFHIDYRDDYQDTAVNIGQQTDTGNFFDGKIDEVAIWDAALSADAIAELWDQDGGTVGPSNLNVDKDNYTNSGDLKGWWRFEEGTGTTIADSSGNGNTGTLNGATFDTSNIPS
jgi:hypothetical protein